MDYTVTNGNNVLKEGDKKKTVLRTIRLPSDVDEVVRTDAQSKGISENVLLNMMLRKYIESDRFNEKVGVVTVSRATFRNLLERADDDCLVAAGKVSGQERPGEMMRFPNGHMDVNTFSGLLELLSKYNCWFNLEHTVAGEEHVFVLHHDLGSKWSTFLNHYVSEAAKVILGAMPTGEEHKNYVAIKITSRT